MQRQRWLLSDAQPQRGNTVTLSSVQVTGDHDVTPRRDCLFGSTLPELFWARQKRKWRLFTAVTYIPHDPDLQIKSVTNTWLCKSWVVLLFFFVGVFSPCGRFRRLALSHQTRRQIHTLPAKLTNLICPPPPLPHPSPEGSMPRTSPGTDEEHLLHSFYESWLNRLSRGVLAGLNCLLDAALSSPPWPDFNKNWVKLTRNGVLYSGAFASSSRLTTSIGGGTTTRLCGFSSCVLWGISCHDIRMQLVFSFSEFSGN